MKKYTVLLFFSLAFARSSNAAGYSTSFNSGYITSQQLAGQDGWVIDDNTPNLSFFVNWNGSNAGALGGYHDVPIGTSARLSHPVSLPFAESSFGADFGVIPSTVTFPGRDSFGFSVHNTSGFNLVTIRFQPDTVNSNLLNITWSTGASSSVTTGWAIEYDGFYHLEMDFAQVGSDIQFGATVSSTNTVTFNGTLPGLAGETWGSIGSDFVLTTGTAGDNYMVFDNINVVPEPSMSVFLSVVAMGGLLRRRRVNC
jgi:hypothetical protein